MNLYFAKEINAVNAISNATYSEDPRITRLELLFRRTCSLPQLPTALYDLLKAVDDENSSAHQIEHIIVADPTLTAKVLQVANSCWGTGQHKTANVREAVLRIGTASIRSLALSLMVSCSLAVPGSLCRKRLAKHCLYVAFISRYLFVRHSAIMGDDWTKDEVFAAGLLHDLSIPLLGSIDGPLFERVTAYAQRNEITLVAAFDRLFKKDLYSLSALACQTWNLPPIFAETMLYLGSPWLNLSHFPETACIAYAEYLANSHGITVESWPVQSVPEMEVTEVVELPAEEIEMLMEKVREQVEDFLVNPLS